MRLWIGPKRRQQSRDLTHAAEDAALGVDHGQTHGLKGGKIGADTFRRHQTFITAIVGLAHRGIDADFGGHARHGQLLYAAMAKHRLEIGGVKRALAGIVDHGFARLRIWRDNPVGASR